MERLSLERSRRFDSWGGALRLLVCVFFLGAVLGLAGCSEGRKRPPGYLRLGHVRDLLGAATDLKGFDLILRRDEGGLSAMSTACTYDLSRLALRKTERGLVLVSTLSSSSYDIEGRVLTGPAKAPLPYYELRFEPGVYGSPRDTLYVYIGREVDPSWRLPVTAEMEAAARSPAPELGSAPPAGAPR